jgi:hypothetical protein
MTEPNDPIVTPTIVAPSVAIDGGAQNGRQPSSDAQAQNGAPAQHAIQAQTSLQAPAAGPVPERAQMPVGGQVADGATAPVGDQDRGTTAAQLRRFIKSRPYVPMHELRRRFELNGDCDDVVAIETPDGRCYIGLPEREGRFMADLVRQGEVGIELGHDPDVPIVIGVFPMRPVGR